MLTRPCWIVTAVVRFCTAVPISLVRKLTGGAIRLVDVELGKEIELKIAWPHGPHSNPCVRSNSASLMSYRRLECGFRATGSVSRTSGYGGCGQGSLGLYKAEAFLGLGIKGPQTHR